MGVSASGATLEIQLVADVARLKSDMAQMQAVVDNATGGITQSLNRMSKGAGSAAAEMAAAAQASARAATTQAGGFNSVASAAHLTTLELRETLVATRELYSGNFTRLPGSLTLLSQSIKQAGGLGSYGAALLSTLGILKTVQNAELAEVAAQKAAVAASVESRAERAAAAVTARQAQVVIAQAELQGAVGAEAEAAAQGNLTKALRSVEVAAGRSAIANRALAASSTEATIATDASKAAAATSLTAMGVALSSIAALAALAFGVWLIQRLTDTDRAVEGLVKKLDEKYLKTLDEAEANRIWANSLGGVADAMGKIADKTAELFKTDTVTAAVEAADAQRKLSDALKQQAAAQKQLADARKLALEPQVGMGQGAPTGNPGAAAAIENAQRTLRLANAAVANATRALSNLQIATATAQGKTIADVGDALAKRAEDAEAMLQRRATDGDAIGKAVKGSLVDEIASLEKLRKAFGDAASAGDTVGKQAAGMKTQMEGLVDQLNKGAIAPDKFAKSVLGMAAALEAAAKAAKDNPIEKFEAAIIGAEGTGANRMGSKASGFGQFMPDTWLSYFNKTFPAQANALSDAAKLAFRDKETVAKAVIDTAAHDYANILKSAGEEVTKANLYAMHLLSSGDPRGTVAMRLLKAPSGEDMRSVLGKNYARDVRGNPFLAGTAGSARAAIAKRIGDSDSVISQGTAALAQWNAEVQQALDKLDALSAGQIKLAGAYLQGDAAALKAEASQKAEEEAIRLHADAAQLAVLKEKELTAELAKDAAEGAKKVAQLRDETTIRKAVNDNVAAGTLSYRHLSREMQDQAALQPLLTLQSIAQGDAYTLLTEIIEAYRKALAGAHAEEDRSQALEELGKINDQHRVTAALLTAEQGLVGTTIDRREEVLKLLQKELELRQQFPAMTEQEIGQVIAQTAAEDELKRHLQQVEAGYDALRQTGEQMIDTLFNVDNWTDPLKMALQLVKQLEQSFVTMAFANPLKNKLFGENLPTLDNVGGVKGFFSGVAGKGAGGASLGAAGTQLSTAGATLNTAGAELTSAGTVWQGVALQIQAAATQLAAAGASGGAGGAGGGLGGIGGILGLLGGGGAGGGVTSLDIGSFASNMSNAAAPLIDVPAFPFASGGFVSGPGGPRSDSIPAMLSNGEYVMSANAVQKFGPGFLDAMNQGRIPHKSGGGLLGALSFLSPLAFLASHTGKGFNPLEFLSPAAFLATHLGKHSNPLELLSPGAFLASKLFDNAPQASNPQAANSNAPSGDTYHIHVVAPNTGDPLKDRQTGMQFAAGIEAGMARRRSKGTV